MHQQQNLKSAFSVVKEQKYFEDYLQNIQLYAKTLIQFKQKIKVIQFLSDFELPVFFKLIFNLIITLLTGCTSDLPVKSIIAHLLKNPLSLKINVQVFKLIAFILQNKLFIIEQQKYYEEIGFSMIFKNHLLPFATIVLSDNSNFIRMDRFNELYRALMQNNPTSILLNRFFYLYGGSGIKISKEDFQNYLANVIYQVGTFFTTQQSIITRNISFIKNLKDQKRILDDSVTILSNFRNNEYIRIQIQLLADEIFANETYLSQNVFIQVINYKKTIKTDEKSLPLSQYLRVYFDLLHLQFAMIQSSDFKSQVLKREYVETSNYYLQSMQKMLKKCPYNGHESCNCKKCNCVRRNRQSAKLSQQKKRNAVEQLGQMQQRINELQKRNQYLEEYNLFLRGLFDQIKDHPSLKDIMSKTVEPISKILNNDSQ